MKKALFILALWLCSLNAFCQVDTASVPTDVGTSSICIIKYGYADWLKTVHNETNQPIDEKSYQRTFKHYLTAIKALESVLRKNKIHYQIIAQRALLDSSQFDYVVDHLTQYRLNDQVDVAYMIQGGLYFENLRNSKKYEPIILGRTIQYRVQETVNNGA